ncbi:MAG TPA: proton-conducting transporter membrane subunit [Candidatus Limnocylindria bacterium]|jgi:NADH-quinone oxidoreductase subunit N
MSAAELGALGPALILAGSAAVATVLAIPRRTAPRILAWLAAVAAVAVATLTLASGTGTGSPSVARDGASVFFVALIAIVTAVSCVVAAADPRRTARSKDETALALFAACGAVVVVSAVDLVVLFVGLALLSIPLYVLTGRTASTGDEGVVRHFLLGATGSAVALYGMALLYAATGETGYAGLGRATHNPLYLAGLGLTLAGLVSHVATAPGHRWSVVMNVAVIGALLRLVAATGTGQVGLDWQVSLASIAAVALVVPGIASIAEHRLRRLIGYATIAQLGFVAAAAASAALPAAAFALTVYSAQVLGLFTVLAILPQREPVLDDLAGLARRRPLAVLALGLLALGLIGVPPTGGFLAKVYVLEAAVRAQLLWLVVLGALASVATAVAYARLVLACFAAPRLDAVAPSRMRVGTAVAVVIAIAVLAAGLAPGPLLDAAQTVRF